MARGIDHPPRGGQSKSSDEDAGEIARLEAIVEADKKEEQNKIDKVIADIDSQYPNAPQFGRARSSYVQQSRQEMQEEMDALGAPPEPNKEESAQEPSFPSDADMQAALIAEGRIAPEPVIGDEEIEEVVEEGEEEPAESGPDTPQEWRNLLATYAQKAGTNGVLARGESDEDIPAEVLRGEEVIAMTTYQKHFEGRTDALDEELKKMGRVEETFRKWGERYDKLRTPAKILVGATLGIGAGVSLGTGFLSVFTIFGAGLVAQRTAGLASMFLRMEKGLQNKKWAEGEWAKGLALTGAALWSVGMGAAIKEGVEWIAEMEWLEKHYPFNQTGRFSAEASAGKDVPAEGGLQPEGAREAATGAGTLADAEKAAPAPGASAGADAGAPAQETVAEASGDASPIPEAPEVTVEAKEGRGYEWMLKRMWEQLEAQGLNPDEYPEGSDIRTLLEADEKSIDGVVHKLATSHGAFIAADGTSKIVQAADIISLGADGNITLNGDTVANALEDRGVTPPYPPAESVPQPQEPLEATQVSEQAPAPELTVAETPLVAESVSPDLQTSSSSEFDTQQYPEGAPEVPEAEVSTETNAEVEFPTTKIDGAPIDPRTPAVYEIQSPSGEKYFYAYGGTEQERLDFIQEKFLTLPENAGKSVRYEHTVPSIFGPKVEISAIGAGDEKNSFFLSFFRGSSKAPALETFMKKVSL